MHLFAGGGNKDWKAAAEGGADTGGKLQPKAVILHAPHAGNDSPNCIAYRLARCYMQRFCPRWSARYLVQQLSRSVYTQLRFKTSFPGTKARYSAWLALDGC